ncbi:MAG: class I SAM-dependent methyltransferase [Anaerolineae bacterium]|nr:class I SAM-dependent methyltransferase [Anaerolineae bacterium]
MSVSSGESFAIREGIPVLYDETQLVGLDKQYQGFYRRVAGVYDVFIQVWAWVRCGGERQLRTQYLSELEIQPGHRVLEVSVGTGGNLHYLPPHAEYYGLDLSWAMLNQCQRNLKRWGREAELIFGNAEDLPFQDEVFDVVFHMGGINVFNDRAKAMSEMVRVARPGTRIVIVDETSKAVREVQRIPGVKRRLGQYPERFAAPVSLVPPGVTDVAVRDIIHSEMYCLTFRTPERPPRVEDTAFEMQLA